MTSIRARYALPELSVLFMLAVAGSAASVLGAWRLGLSSWASLIYAVLALASGYCAVRLVSMLRDRRTILEIDSNGILDRSLFDRPIPWHDVRAVKETRNFKQGRIFQVSLRRPLSDFADPQRLVRRRWLGRAYDNDLQIRALGLTTSADAIRDVLRRHAEASGRFTFTPWNWRTS